MNQEGTVRARLLGAWRITAYVTERADGDRFAPLGDSLQGYICYTQDGVVSVNLQQPNREPYASGDPSVVTTSELAAAAAGYFAYAGRFVVDETTAIVTHDVEISLVPNWIGTQQRRTVIFDGDRLELRAIAPSLMAGEMRTIRVFWQRVR
jgi:hypothetical protein